MPTFIGAVVLLLAQATTPAQPSQPGRVECTNCGGTDSTSLIVAFVALAISLAALIIGLREHRVFMRQVKARAVLGITIRSVHADKDGVIRTGGTGQHPAILEIGLSNTGEKAATATTVNVLVPTSIANTSTRAVDFVGSRGEPLGPPAPRNTAPNEVLPGADGGSTYLIHEIPRISLRTPLLFHCAVTVPILKGKRTSVPLRVTAQTDDLPEKVQEVVEDYIIRTEHRDAV